MSTIARLIREPLVHFIAIGGVFYLIASAAKPPLPDERKIIVDEAALTEFIQFRSKAFDAPTANMILTEMSAADVKALTDDFVREEVLYREAKALGLEADDYVVKQRLIQKFDALNGAIASAVDPDEAEVAAFYEAHKDDYAQPATATFTHVFFKKERGGPVAEAAAEEMTMALVGARAPFEAAVGKGDRFPFGVNYVDRTIDEIASQFGDAAAAEIFDPKGPFGVWRGPVASLYGSHAIFVRKATPGRTPPLEEVRAAVVEDARIAAREKAKESIVEGAIKRYRVEYDLPKAAAKAP